MPLKLPISSHLFQTKISPPHANCALQHNAFIIWPQMISCSNQSCVFLTSRAHSAQALQSNSSYSERNYSWTSSLPTQNQCCSQFQHVSSYLLFQACSISQSPCFLAIRDSKTDCSCWGVSSDDESSLAWIFSVQFRNSPSSICQKENC